MYAQFVDVHPVWEQQPVDNEQVEEHGDLPTWAEVFRRIGLDERDHMNKSFALCDKPGSIVAYDGMPEIPKVAGLFKK